METTSDPPLAPEAQAPAGFEVTASAAERIKVLTRDLPPTAGLRIAVKGGGCSGLTLHMDLADAPKPKDKRFERDGAQVFVDARSFLYLQGSKLDFFQTLMQSGFRIHNPNKKTECGCGESFSV